MLDGGEGVAEAGRSPLPRDSPEDMRPIILVSDDTSLETASNEVAALGWTTRRGFRLEQGTWDVSDARVVCFGSVATFDDVNLALLAVVRGAGLVARVADDGEVRRRLNDNLRHLGRIEQRSDSSGEAAALSADQIELCRMLGRGMNLAAAAQALHVSRRTAARRLHDARETLGVSTSREAVLIACTQTRSAATVAPRVLAGAR